eukprot:tig00000157_g9675.t1
MLLKYAYVRSQAALLGNFDIYAKAGTSTMIMDAVRAAKPGQTIFLAPGRYNEQVTLDKDVHIVGPREAVLKWDQGSTLKCTGPAAPTVKGITIRCTAPKSCAVWITGGSRAVVEGCDVSSAGLNGIEARDEGTTPTLRGNTVHDCGQAGILFHTLAKGVAEANDVYGNALSDIKFGIVVRDGGKGAVSSSMLEDAVNVAPDCTGCRLEGNTVRII